VKRARSTSLNVCTGLLLAALCAVAACALVLAPAASFGAGGAPTPPVDLNAPVKAGAQCAPCHARIADAVRPGLKFTHASHLLVSCDGCHWGPAHRGGATVGPPMESCFNCHGVAHGPKPIARGDCPACHTPSFKLRPSWHVAGWKAKPHADRAAYGQNTCLMCHDAKAFCDACHVKEAPKAPPTQAVFRPVLRAEPARSPLMVYPEAQVSMGQCVKCHPDLDNFLPGRVIFAHGQHLQMSFRCESCHKKFAHGPDETYRPDMPTCYACHGLAHASRALVATQECSACHPKDFKLKPADHTPEFAGKGHKGPANKQPEMCAMCHEPSFCTACHQGRPTKPGGPARTVVIPVDHKRRDFVGVHGKNYLKKAGACASCHDGTTCMRCHKTPVPHPPDWGASHALALNIDAQDCNVCHRDRSRCQQCHHQDLRGAELIESNCVRCHPQMKKKPATDIKNKGFAEHAVHFEVAKTKGKPYRCQDCHIGFVMSPQVKRFNLQLGHDLRLCFECHGALDYRHVNIAPYPGNTLCYRCHKGRNF
jgi:hypothetical protein